MSSEARADLLTLQVNGRAALPVRSIPFLTGWRMPPDELASQLARVQGPPFDRLRNTHAYQLVDGQPIRISPAEWERVVVRLEGLEARIRRETPHERPGDDPEGYDRWCRSAVPELPAGVFLWRDEFERDFAVDWNRVLRAPSETLDEALIYAPMALHDNHKLVFEGFPTDLSSKALRRFSDEERAGQSFLSMGKLPRGIGPADWEKWAMLPAVRLSQALLLSIGGEPDDWPDYGVQEVGQSLLERRRIALSHVRAGQLPLLERETEPIESTVSLADFATWARGLGWQLPSDFPSDVSRHFRFGSLARWLAIRQHEGSSFRDILEREVVSANWTKELRDAAHRGELRVREPTTHSLVDTPYADAIVLTAELRQFLAARSLSHLLEPAKRVEVGDAAETPDAQAGVDASKEETPEVRRDRLRARFDEVKATGVRDYSKRVADEEGITPARLRQILKEKSPPQPASPFDFWRKR